MDCICEETRISYRKDGLVGNAAVRYHCAAHDHGVPRKTLPVRQKALPLYPATAGTYYTQDVESY